VTAIDIGRPLIHYAPQRNWMNDPNGLVYVGGRYHMFYQYNPLGTDHSNMSWGHASSTDLVDWVEHPVALWFDQEEQVYSGSAVIDIDNTAGFAGAGQTALVAIYTSARDVNQSQSLAYSLDEGMTWTKHAGNPVLDRGSAHFRDPKVFRYEHGGESYWVMVAVEAVQRRVVFYRSGDLKRWTRLSSYGPAGAVGGIWECPDLFPLQVDGDPDQVRWVLLISLFPGGIAGGSGTQYVVGQFDGVRFTPDHDLEPVVSGQAELASVDWLDRGRDCYAGVTFHGLPDTERILIAWMSNWDYARQIPDAPWRGTMTTPRALSLITIDGRPQLRATPILGEGIITTELSGAIGEEAISTSLPAAGRIDLCYRADVGAELVMSIGSDSGDSADAEHGDVTLVCGNDSLRLERRSYTYIHNAFDSIEFVPLPASPEGRVAVSIVLDVGSIEVFAQDGVRTITDLISTDRGPQQLRLASRKGQVALDSLTVRAIAM